VSEKSDFPAQADKAALERRLDLFRSRAASADPIHPLAGVISTRLRCLTAMYFHPGRCSMMGAIIEPVPSRRDSPLVGAEATRLSFSIVNKMSER